MGTVKQAKKLKRTPVKQFLNKPKKQFKDFTLVTQRKKIIKDAIAQIDKTIIPKAGDYVDIPHDFRQKKTGLKEMFEEGKVKCEACLKGSLLIGCVLNVNKVTTYDEYGSEPFIVKKLSTWFSPLELDMMETAFEQTVIEDNTMVLRDEDYDNLPLANKCIAFGRKYKTDKKRLLAILNNMLENGKFKP